MIFPNHIVVRSLSGNVNAAIGNNILGADEIDFMARVKEAKQSADGGAFDQAVEMHTPSSVAGSRGSWPIGLRPGSGQLTINVVEKKYCPVDWQLSRQPAR